MPDPAAIMGAAIMNAIADSSQSPETGETLVDPHVAMQALIVSLGMILEAGPDIQTPKQMRELSEAVGKQVLRQVRFLRAHYEATGERTWDARPIVIN